MGQWGAMQLAAIRGRTCAWSRYGVQRAGKEVPRLLLQQTGPHNHPGRHHHQPRRLLTKTSGPLCVLKGPEVPVRKIYFGEAQRGWEISQTYTSHSLPEHVTCQPASQLRMAQSLMHRYNWRNDVVGRHIVYSSDMYNQTLNPVRATCPTKPHGRTQRTTTRLQNKNRCSAQGHYGCHSCVTASSVHK